MDYINNKKISEYRKTKSGINDLMKRGICSLSEGGPKFYTGYVDRILFDWDQYFESILQIYMGWSSDLIKNGVLIFLDTQQSNGLITRSVPPLPPDENEHVKPFLAQIINLVRYVYQEDGWLTDSYYKKLVKYINYWLDDMDSNKNGLSEWMSSVHTGMDNQHERAGYWNERFCEGVDLNSYLFLELKAMSDIAESMGYTEDALKYESRSEKIKKLILTEMWDEEEGFFYDLDIRTGKKIKVKSISSFTPLFAEIATPEQARRMIYEHLFNANEFWSPYPVSAYAKSEPGYREELNDSDVGCNWRANTWINTNYMLYHSLKYYGYEQLADLVAHNTLKLVKKSGNREYYNSESGEGIKQDPFWGWSLLAHFLPLESQLEFDIPLAGRGRYIEP